jgi:coiled-coil domain-containing protein 130
MSSLAAARADAYYNPPDWDPRKQSRNAYQGSHALGARARKLDDGILIVRFEMPFPVWCAGAGCGHLIGRGVRFNAEKRAAGAHLSTKVWEFAMRAPCCAQRIVFATDPARGDFAVVSGARRKAEAAAAPEEGRPALEAGGAARAARGADAAARLEHEAEDRARARAAREELAALRAGAAALRDDYGANAELRQRARGARREEAARDARRRELGLPDSIPLVPEAPGDALRAAAVAFGGGERHAQAWRHARRRIAQDSIFAPAAVAAARGGGGGGGGGAGARAAPAASRGGGTGARAAPAASRGGRSGAAAAAAPPQHKRRRLDAGVRLRLTDPK